MNKISVLSTFAFLFHSGIAASAVQVTDDEAVIFYGYDVLGSPVSVSDDQGRVLWRENSQPFGASTGRVSDDSVVLDVSNSEEPNSRLSYTGHQADSIAGLIYMKARYYDPAVGRFYSNDPVGYAASKPMTFNRYSYANNNPYILLILMAEMLKTGLRSYFLK